MTFTLSPAASVTQHRATLALSFFCAPTFCGLMLLLPQNALAMPGAPMMKLVDLTPACSIDPRPVFMHEAFGQTFPNDLPDWAEVVIRTVESLERSGALAQRRSTLNRYVLTAAETPLSGVRLPRATLTRSHRIPVPPEAATALRGLRAEGDSLLSGLSSLFATSRPARTMLLIDAEDRTQLVWAIRERHSAFEAQHPLPRIVVSAGTVTAVRDALVAAEDPDPRAWADQGGTIRRRTAVTALPARITVDPEGILVEELMLDDEGRVWGAQEAATAHAPHTEESAQ